MKVGIIRYPGSNCDYDMMRYFYDSIYVWHKEDILKYDIDLLVIPGGFAFGDRLYHNATSNYTISPGKMAVESPVTKIIYGAVKSKIPISVELEKKTKKVVKLELDKKRQTKKLAELELVKKGNTSDSGKHVEAN